MKRAIALILALVFALSLAACNNTTPPPDEGTDPAATGEGETTGVFRVGMECDYAPFNWTATEATDRTVPISSGGYADGYDVQIAKLVAEGLGMELEIVKIEWDGLPLAVQADKIDAIIAGMSPLEERKATLDFTDPYYESDLVIVVRKDSPYAAATQLSDFAGAKITGQLNTFHYSVIDQIEGVNKQTAMETFPAMIVALGAGGIDGYISERPGAKSAVASNPDLTYIEFAEGKGFECSLEDVAISIGLAKGSDLAARINEILAGITREQRQQLMEDALANQPLSA